jgi:hypothetical protein
MLWGTPDEVTRRIIEAARAPALTTSRPASTAGCFRTRCAWSRSAALLVTCSPGFARHRVVMRVRLAEEVPA